MSKTKPDRSTQITIRLDPKILDGLHEIAARIGIAPTTVAGMAIGEYVAKSQAAFNAQTVMMESTGKELAKIVGGPLAAILADKTPEELKELFKDD